MGASRLGELWDKVGWTVREPYISLRRWLEACRDHEAEPVDLFVTRLFGELLSQPGFGCHRNRDRARSCGRLVESAQKFRLAVGRQDDLSDETVAREYVQLVLGGIASAEYVEDWPDVVPPGAVILAPAYAYLTRDLRSRYQFWIDLASDGWWHRPNQPLTHPYVLSRHWPTGQPWSDSEEDRARREALGRIVQGLASRCSEGIYLASSQLGIDGGEQRGRLERIYQNAQRRMQNEGEGNRG
jgi:hypothetical protein